MIRLTVTFALLLAAVPATAQNQQDELQSRYDRALAAGYKALMLCGAIGNAGPSGGRRSELSVETYELSGIQAPLAALVGYLAARVEFGVDRSLDYVAVDWSPDAPPRTAIFQGHGSGCSLLPIGAIPPVGETKPGMPIDKVVSPGSARPQPPQTTGRFADLARTAFAPRYGAGARTTAVLIQRGGKVIGEAFAPGFDGQLPQRTWSVAKSIAATLIGAAVLRGEVDVTASAGLGIDGADPRRAITIDHALRMASGRYSDTPGNRTDALYFGGSTVREIALHWPLVHRPGTVFRYANNDTLAATQAISAMFERHPPAALFEQLGMDQTVAETDWQGSYILSSQVWTTARDLARLGQLYLDDGILPDGTRVLPENWNDYVAAPDGPQPDGEFGYGAGFWLMNRSEGVPSDAYAMFGNRGQYVVIVPSRNVVLVRRGEDPAGSRFDIAAFTRDVLAALE